MAGEIYESLHIISLVINRRQDIPLIRTKVKLLAHAAGSPRLFVTQVATAASEISRLLWRKYGGGKADFAIIHSCGTDDRTGIELQFEGRKPSPRAISMRSLPDWPRCGARAACLIRSFSPRACGASGPCRYGSNV